MSVNPSLGDQLRGLVSAVRHYDESRATLGPQDTESSLMALVWPLLPLLPPHPPILVSDLLAQQNLQREACDVCGSSAVPKHDTSGAEMRQPGQTSIAELMADIEKQMEETLAYIESNTQETLQLKKQTNELELAGKSQMSDSEMLKTLQLLIKEKSDREEKVKILEKKEHELTESLITTIRWAKDMTRDSIEVSDESNQQP